MSDYTNDYDDGVKHLVKGIEFSSLNASNVILLSYAMDSHLVRAGSEAQALRINKPCVCRAG